MLPWDVVEQFVEKSIRFCGWDNGAVVVDDAIGGEKVVVGGWREEVVHYFDIKNARERWALTGIKLFGMGSLTSGRRHRRHDDRRRVRRRRRDGHRRGHRRRRHRHRMGGLHVDVLR